MDPPEFLQMAGASTATQGEAGLSVSESPQEGWDRRASWVTGRRASWVIPRASRHTPDCTSPCDRVDREGIITRPHGP